ncbi:MAG: transcription elongation factor GreA [Chloroflexota bacterium]
MSTNEPVYMTEEGLQKAKERLEYLTTIRRKEVAALIKEAKAEGDLRENAGYDEAKTQQGFLEGEIRDLETKLKYAQVIEEESRGTVSIGSTIVIQEIDTDIEETYEIVGSMEADPSNGRISNESPMGKAFLGRRKGTKVKVDTPGGQITFKVLRIE